MSAPAGPVRIATLTVMRGEVGQLTRLLPSLAWADERHVVETGPDYDATLQAAAGARVHRVPRPLGAGFDDARAAALASIEAEWTLVVDTDESIPGPLVELLRENAAAWAGRGIQAVWLPRLNHVFEKPLWFSSTWPDYQLRFLQTATARFTPKLHQGIAADGTTHRLPADPERAILHHNFRSTSQFMEKLNLYSTIEADQGGRGGASTLTWAIGGAAREFLARYVKMRGYRDGAEGLHYCALHAVYRYLIASKRWEEARPVAEAEPSE